MFQIRQNTGFSEDLLHAMILRVEWSIKESIPLTQRIKVSLLLFTHTLNERQTNGYIIKNIVFTM